MRLKLLPPQVIALLFLSLVTISLQAATPIASFSFDESDWETTLVVTDSTGNHHGNIIGTMLRNPSTSVTAHPNTCASASFIGGSTIDIAGLPVSTVAGDKTSVSFWMYWDGSSSVMPIGWKVHDLYFAGGSFGFNTGGGDIYGISSAGLENGWHHVVAIFTNHQVLDNQLYIDGVEQTLTHVFGTIRDTASVVQSDFRIGGWYANNSYNFSGHIDEVNIYNGALNQAEVDNDFHYSVSGACPIDPPPPPPPAPQPEQLIASYSFNDDWSSSLILQDMMGSAHGVVNGLVSRQLSPANGVKPETCAAGDFSGGSIDISTLPVSTLFRDKTSISFWMFWDGSNAVMPVGWRVHDLYFAGSSFGFNSGGGDIYGISSSGLENSWHHVTAVFTNNHIFDNKIYIDGIEQTLTHLFGTISNTRSIVQPELRIGGWYANDSYRFKGQLDEIKIYTGEISQATIDLNRLSPSYCTSRSCPNLYNLSDYTQVFSDDFEDGDLAGWASHSLGNTACNWSVVGGKLKERTDACNSFLEHNLVDDNVNPDTANDYIIIADIDSNQGNTANNGVGFVFAYQDKDNYYLVNWTDYSDNYSASSSHKDFKLIKVENGVKTTLDQRDNISLPVHFTLTVATNETVGIQVFINCDTSIYKLSAPNEKPFIQGFGLYSRDNDGGVFYDNVEVLFNSLLLISEASNFNCVATGNDVITGHLYTKLSNQAFKFDVAALETSTSLAAGFNNTVTIELVDASSGSNCSALPVLTPAITQSLTFTSSTGIQASNDLTSTRAYKNLKCRVTDLTTGIPVIGCSTDSFTIRPVNFDISSPLNNNNNSGSPTERAGTVFDITAATNITNYDGVPVINASLISAHAGATLLGNLAGIFPAADPNTGNSTGMDFTYSEVGNIQLNQNSVIDSKFAVIDKSSGDCTDDSSNTANVDGKFGCNIANTTAVDIGRFIPDHFEVSVTNQGSFGGNSYACTGFNYFGQNFSYLTKPELKVTAFNGLTPSTITQNYTGNYAKITIGDFKLTTPTTDANQLGVDGNNLVNISWSAMAPTLTDNSNGSLSLLFGDDQFNYLQQSNSLVAPFYNAVEFQFTEITDSDTVSSSNLPQSLTPSGALMHFGRLNISNNHGSELVPIIVPMKPEYFNGINWSKNTLDSCTSLNLATNITLSNPTSGNNRPGNTAMTIESSSSTASFVSMPIASGEGNLSFSAPGEDNHGYINIKGALINFEWLQFDWNNDGSFNENPSARVSFGLFNGGEKLIFRREVY